MKHILFIALSATMMLTASCRRPDYDQFLSSQDSIILTDPKLVLENLEADTLHKYKGGDEAYYNLLLTMARDKNYYQFDNDSLISVSQKWFSHSRDLYNQARSTLYLGLVRYRVDTRDTSIPGLLLDAEKVLTESGINDLSVAALIESYLGVLYYRESEYLNAEKHLKSAVYINETRGASSNLVANLIDLSNILVADHKADEATDCLDRVALIMDAGGGVEYQDRYINARAVCCNYSEDYKAALEWARMLASQQEYESRKAQLLSQIFQKLGETDSALFYKQAAIDNRRQDDSLFYYVHYHGLAELYAEKGDYMRAYEESCNAFDWLMMSAEKRKENRIAELEKKYDISMKYVEKSELRQSRLIFAVILFALLFVAALVALFYVRTLTRKRDLEKSLEKEKLLRRIVAATASPVSGLLPTLNTYAINIYSNDMKKEDLSDKLNHIIDSVKAKQTKEFKSIIKDCFPTFSPAMQAALNVFRSDSYKVVVYLLEQGYNSTEVAGMSGMSAASVRSVASQFRKLAYADPAFTDGMRAELKILRQQ